MVSLQNVFLKYGDRVLFDEISLTIGEKDKIGLVGRNGAGKSTLLKILAKETSADAGQVILPPSTTLGFLHQDMEIINSTSILEETLTAFDKIQLLQKEFDDLNAQVAERTDYESDGYNDLLHRLAQLAEKLDYLGASNMEGAAEKVLRGLGFERDQFEMPTATLSGGWRMRIELAKILLQKPDLLLLDEPTNHLDIESILWLEDFLQNSTGSIIIISHDITFLDKVTKRTVEVEMGNLYDYKAPYSKYLQLREERREKLESAYRNQQKVIAQKERTITRFMAKANKTKMAQSMQKQLEKMERIELDTVDTTGMNLRFAPAPRSGEVVVEASQLTKKYDDNTVLSQVDFKAIRGQRIAFVGQNGQGKTTLARMVVRELFPTGGKIELGHNVQIGYYAQNQADALDPNLNCLQVLEQRANDEWRPKLRGLLGAFLFSGEDAEKKVRVLSGGERARLAIAAMLLHPFNLLVLDEPTNHLDMISKEILKKALIEYNGTLIVVSHDRDFLGGLTDRTIEFRDGQLHEYLGDVNTFLEKRQLDNMREAEKRSKIKKAEAEAKAITNVPTEIDYQARRKLQRAVSNAEKKIDKLETEIQAIEQQMTKPDFYESPDSQKTLSRYHDLKHQLDQAMERWEEAQQSLDSLEQAIS